MDEDADTHLCLKCKRLFVSLESYIQHRKTPCSSVTSASTSIPSYSVVGENELQPNDFFQSIQLQSNNNESGTSGKIPNKVIVKLGEVVLRAKKEDNVEKSRKSAPTDMEVDAETDDHDYVLKQVRSKKPRGVFVGPKSRKIAFLKQISSEETENVCKLCIKAFDSREAFVNHLVSQKHWKKREEDEHEFEKTILPNAYILAAISPFKCALCSFYFNTHSYLVEHWRSEIEEHNQSESSGFRCSACQFMAKDNDEMLEHLLQDEVHLSNATSLNNSGKSIVISSSDVLFCADCNWTGKRQQALNFHRKYKHVSNNNNINCNSKGSDEGYKCKKCSYIGKRKVSLLGHMSRIHCKKPTVKKEILSESDENDDPDFPERGGDQSEDEKPKRKYSKSHACIHCEEVLGTVVLLHEHIKSAHPDKLLLCEMCSMHFEFESSFVKHKNGRLHKYLLDGLVENAGESTEDDHPCDRCTFRSLSQSGLLFHQALHDGPVYNENEDENADENEERFKRENEYKCPICLEIIKLKHLRLHVISHTTEKPFSCQYCSETFTAKITLTSHIRTKHKEKKFGCPYCPYKTQRRTKLVNHLDVHQRKDERIKKFLCETCGAKFFNQSSLTHHLRLHLPKELGGKTQLCSFPGCRLSFRSPSELVVHNRVHTGERPFLCDDCGYSAKTKHQLTKHERSHNGDRPFKCQHCSYAAALSSQLLRHMRIHTGAKPYSCRYCEYTCNTHENLRKHVLKSKKHVGLYVYKCPHCEFGCNFSSEYKNHILTEHEDATEQKNANDLAFSSVVSGIFSRNEDRKSIDHPSTPYVPRTEQPGYREKMKQKWKPQSAKYNEDLSMNDEIQELTIDETGEDEESAIHIGESKQIDKFFNEMAAEEEIDENGISKSEKLRNFQESFTVVVENNDMSTTAAIKQFLEKNAIVVPIDGTESSTGYHILNGVEMNSELLENSDGTTVYLCVPGSP